MPPGRLWLGQQCFLCIHASWPDACKQGHEGQQLGLRKDCATPLPPACREPLPPPPVSGPAVVAMHQCGCDLLFGMAVTGNPCAAGFDGRANQRNGR